MGPRACVLSLVLALFVPSPNAALAARLQAADLAQPDAFRAVACHELIDVDASEALAFPVSVPSVYRPYTAATDLTGSVMWARLADWTRVRNRKRLSGHYGAIVATPSDFVQWSEKHGEFRDAGGMTEGNMAERLGKREAKNVRVARIDRPGVPMLLVEADVSHLEALRAIYIAVPGGGTRKLYYLPQRPWSEADRLVWTRLRDSVAGGPVKDALPPVP
jgi:hypothetical protein